MNDSRLTQSLSAIDEARTHIADILEEGGTTVNAEALRYAQEHLNLAIIGIRNSGHTFECECGHTPNSHRFDRNTGKSPCTVCVDCDCLATHHPYSHSPKHCGCTDFKRVAL